MRVAPNWLRFARQGGVASQREERPALRSLATLVAVAPALFVLACASSGSGTSTVATDTGETSTPSSVGGPADSTGSAKGAEIDELRKENDRLHQALAEREQRLAELEERNATLDTELANAVEEVLRSKAAMTGVQNRALAVSRIAEVRVAVQALADSTDAEVLRRLNRATDLLHRADEALAEENFGGAGFLAERASELVRQARTVAEIRSSAADSDILPIVPPRDLEVTSNANLRSGPGVDTQRVGTVGPGDHLRALARSGPWFEVETAAGVRAWIHGSLVR